MNILVTGANGFIGKHIIELLKNKYKIYQIINNKIYSRNDNIFSINLINKNHIASIMNEDIKIDFIIHTASKMASIDNLTDIKLLQDNIEIYNNLSALIKYFNPLKVINLSSIAVYPNKDQEFSEVSEIKPSYNSDSLYGLSKVYGENLLDIMNSNIDIVHLRIAQVYGNGMRDDRIIPIFKKELLENNTITIFGNGERIIPIVEVKSIVNIINSFLESNKIGIYNICDENINISDLALRIISSFGDDKSVIIKKCQGSRSKQIINIDKLIKYKKQNFKEL